jgi:hypothetical protein
MLKRWDKLTFFLRRAGVPLDNNTCERVLKMAIRHRRNSLFYRSERGAEIGDMFMSLIHTAERRNPLRLPDRHAALRESGCRQSRRLAAVDLPRHARAPR